MFPVLAAGLVLPGVVMTVILLVYARSGVVRPEVTVVVVEVVLDGEEVDIVERFTVDYGDRAVDGLIRVAPSMLAFPAASDDASRLEAVEVVGDQRRALPVRAGSTPTERVYGDPTTRRSGVRHFEFRWRGPARLSDDGQALLASLRYWRAMGDIGEFELRVRAPVREVGCFRCTAERTADGVVVRYGFPPQSGVGDAGARTDRVAIYLDR